MNKSVEVTTLTSYNPETFLYVSGVDASTNEINPVDISISGVSGSGYVYIDAKRVELSKGCKEEIKYDDVNNYIRIFADPRQCDEFSFNVSINDNSSYSIKYTPSIIKDSNNNDIYAYNYPYNSNILSSFMLIRTNPKLTGNIKLVVDSSNNMFLDTFPINPTLANKKYRKQRISTESYYSNDIRNVFGTMPSGDLYDLPKLEKDSTIPISDYNDQYINTYYYGVRNNFDNIYKENFAMLAPLWINKNLPEFFVIFKYDDIYSNDASTAADDINNIIKNGKIIKYFDLRKNTVIGNYLRRHQSEIENYLNSVKISYNDNNDIEWNGISVRSGIMTTAKDSTYDINHVENQVMHDKYITLGYEQNDLISPYIINFEFMFDDKTSDDFKINRYVGLYLTSDKFEEWNSSDVSLNSKIKNIINEEKDDAFKSITSFIKDNEFSLCNNSFDISVATESLKNKTDKSSFSLLCNKNQNNIKYFNLTIKKPLKCGEHLRIVKNDDISTHNKGEYWDVIGAKMTDDILTLDTISDANKMEVFYDVYNNETINKFNDITVHSSIFTGYFNNYANIFYNDNESDIIKVQTSQIARSFLKMSDIPFKLLYYTDDTIAFACENKDIDLYFERITSDITHDLVNLAFDSNTSSSVTYFDDIEFDSIKISSTDDNNSLYKCNYFEAEGDRYAQIFKFLDIKNYINITKSDINNSISPVSTNIDWVVEKTDNEFIKFPQITIECIKIDGDKLSLDNYNFNYIKSPDNPNLVMVDNSKNLTIRNDKIFVFEAAKINFNYVNFLAVKDFNFSVLDGNEIKTVYENTTYTKFSKDANLGPIVNSDNPFETYDDYVAANSNLLVPYINKWEVNGTDTFGNKIKATNIFDKLVELDISSFYLADNTKENSRIFANISLNKDVSGVTDNENIFYIKHDINDICKVHKGDKDEYISVKESILKDYNPMILFKDDEHINSRFSVLSYNSDLNILETVFRGRHINITFNQNDLITKNFNNYLFTIICSPTSNVDKDCDVEIIIDMTTEMVVCIYYTEIGNLYYPIVDEYVKTCMDGSTSFIRYPYDLDLFNMINSNYIPYKQDYSNDISANEISLGEKSTLYLSDIVIPDNNSLYANDNYTYSIKLNPNNGLYINDHHDILDISGTSIYTTTEKYTKYDASYKPVFDTSTTAKIRPNNNVIYEYLIDCSVKNKISFNDIENRNNILYIKRKDGDNNIVTKTYDNIVTIKANPLSQYSIYKYDTSKNDNGVLSLNTTEQKYNYIEYGCNPEFIDVFEYKSSDKFIGSNNKIESIKSINCVYNKGDINDTSANVYKNDSLDITKSIWNKKLYGKNFDKTASDLGIINSMFFGSIGLVYFNDIEIEINSSDLTKISDNIKTYNNSNDSNIVDIYTLNIKNYIIESILNNNFKVISNDKSVVKNFNLYDNWKNDVNTNVIYNFIYDILMNRYNMDINNKTNIEVKRQISNKNKIGDRFIKTNSGTTNANLKIDINGDILRIEIPRDEYQYSIKYKIKNKHGY